MERLPGLTSSAAVHPRESWAALDLRYTVLAVAYAGIIIWFVSHSAGPGGDGLVRLAAHVSRVPLYAGLAFFVLQAISQGRAFAAHQWIRGAVTAAAAGSVAAFTELHRAGLPGSEAVLGDLLLDAAGIAVLLFACALGAAQR